MKLKVLSLALSLALLVSCAPAAPKVEPMDFGALLGELNTARQAIAPWTDEEKTLLTPPAPDDTLLTDDEIADLVSTVEEAVSLLPEESAAEVDLFFRALKSAYGAYDYFGGDGVFLPIKDAVLAELADRPPITGGSLGRALLNHLAPVIKDAHFTIDGQPLLTGRMELYYVPDLYFQDGDVLPSPCVKPTIGPDGAIAWCFAALSADGADLPESAQVAGKTVTLSWTKAQNLPQEPPTAYARAEEGCIPTLLCRTLSADLDKAGVKALATGGTGWAQESILAVDLRGNGGGNALYAAKWFRDFADSDPAVKTLFLQNCSRLFSSAARAYADSGAFADQVAANAGAWETARSEGSQVPNRRTVFILQDSATASAGETFVQYLSSLENAVRVGSNTMGCTLSENVMDLCLPKSGVKVRFGSSLSFTGTVENRDGRGILPDLWVNPADAADAVDRLVRYYGLDA